MRYYFDTQIVKKSIRTLKKNINLLHKKDIVCFMDLNTKKEFLNFSKNKLSNFDIIKMIYISKTLKRYFNSCGHKI